jgi:hypothetical protein
MGFDKFQKALTLILSDPTLSRQLLDLQRFEQWLRENDFELDAGEWLQLRQIVERSAFDAF